MVTLIDTKSKFVFLLGVTSESKKKEANLGIPTIYLEGDFNATKCTIEPWSMLGVNQHKQASGPS